MDNVYDIVPNGESRVKTLEFTNTAGDGFRNLIVTADAGSKIYDAVKQIERRIVTEIGIVEQVNWKKFWFVYTSMDRGKSVVCWGTHEGFPSFIADKRLRSGTKVKISGKLNRRVRRDEIVMEFIPEILEW